MSTTSPKLGTISALRLDLMAGGKGTNKPWRLPGRARTLSWSAVSATIPMVSPTGNRLAQLGIDVRAVRVVGGEPTGTAPRHIGRGRENTIVIVAGANAEVALTDAQAVPGVGPGDVVVLQLEIPHRVVAAVAEWAADRGAWWS